MTLSNEIGRIHQIGGSDEADQLLTGRLESQTPRHQRRGETHAREDRQSKKTPYLGPKDLVGV